MCLHFHVCSSRIYVCFRELDVPEASLDFSTSCLSLGTNMQCDESISSDSSEFEPAIGGALLLLGTIASSRFACAL